ncbi:MAG: SDR family NAD(P)-dependent oxidoreductase [Candidatus Binatia bacterium]
MARKVAFITGASRGIGKAAAIALAEAGYDVVVTARTVQEGEQQEYSPTVARSAVMALPGSIHLTAEEVRKRGRDALPIRLDLLDRRSIDAALEQTFGEWGHIDVLLNNGIYEGPGVLDRFLEVSEAMLKQMFDGNFFAPVHITQKVLPSMLRRGQGVVINMTSGAAFDDPPGPVGEGGFGFAYGASKAALQRMAGILHIEHRQSGIRAYTVNPGLVWTEAMTALFAKIFAQGYRSHPTWRCAAGGTRDRHRLAGDGPRGRPTERPAHRRAGPLCGKTVGAGMATLMRSLRERA